VPRNTSGLKRDAGPGRPKGSKNKATVAIKEWLANVFDSEEWRQSAIKRMVSGKAPHLEGHALQVFCPKTDKHQVEGSVTIKVVTGYPNLLVTEDK
jgi:hypothetical protein